jgi:hypothetical protein
MQLTIQITTADDQYQVHTDLFTIVAWERKFKTKASKMGDGIGMEDLAFMAYEASKHAGRTVPAVFDDFIRKIVKIEVVGEEDSNPTHEAPTADS